MGMFWERIRIEKKLLARFAGDVCVVCTGENWCDGPAIG
jgi:hypothetical protein